MTSNPSNPSGGQQPPQFHEGGSAPTAQQYQPYQPTQAPPATSFEGQGAHQAGPPPGHQGESQQYFPPPPPGPPPSGQQPYQPVPQHFDPPPQAHQGQVPPPHQAQSADYEPYKPAPGDFNPPPQPNQGDGQFHSLPPTQVTQSAPYYPPPPSDPSQGISHTGVATAPPPQWKLPEHGGSGADPAQSGGNYPPPPAAPAPSSASGAYPPEKQGDFNASQAGGDYYPPPPPLAGSQQGGVLPTGYQPPLPPRRQGVNFGDDDPNNPIHYTRDPHKLVGYLVPFPKPIVKGVETAGIPDRFLIYTPPPPPLTAPKEGEKEDKLHKLQRKWQEEVRSAKTSDAKTASWKGVKGKATKGISYVMSKTTSSSLDFVNRIPGTQKTPSRGPSPDPHSEDGMHEEDHTHETVGLEEMVLVYPASYKVPPEQVKVEFVNTMMRTRSKAQKDAVIATGLLPVSAAIDIMATLVWPFGGLLEVDGVWAYSSIRGAKTARSVTKRLTSSGNSGTPSGGDDSGPQLHLMFKQSPRLEVLDKYLAAKCQERDRFMFPRMGAPPTETEVLNAIGWAPSTDGGDQGKNWEDEQWETQEVKDDMRMTLGKAAKEWEKWCKAFAKNPEQALKK